MTNGFAGAAAPPAQIPESAIRSVREVVDDYVRETWEANQDRMPQYVLAFHLGISPTTLIRMRKRWSNESTIKDRR